MSEILIIPAKKEDIKGVANVRKATWLVTYPNEEYGITKDDILAEDFYKEKWAQEFEDNLSEASLIKTWVAKADGEVIGYSTAEKESTHNEIDSLYILPQFQGKGVGKRLLEEALKWLDAGKETILEVVSYNTQAVLFYKKMGFEKGKSVIHKRTIFSNGKDMPEIEMIKQPNRLNVLK